MRKNFYLIILALIQFTACTWDKQVKTHADIVNDTLHYKDTTFKQRASDCGNKPDSVCSVIKITYPVFKNAAVLNDTVRKRAFTLFSIYSYAKPDTSFKQLAAHFMKARQQDIAFRHLDVFYTLDARIAVIRQDSSLLTLKIKGYTYQGGAHGSTQTLFINWNTKANKPIGLKDLLIDGYQHQLDSVGESIFRKQEKLSDTTSLKTNYFFYKDKFSLNDNFLITPTGLSFLYNEYEIKPYAAGQTELFIPYQQIKSLLKPNTILSQYSK